ncbi:FAD-dependent oxidoreductase [Antrihabitans spumae]|uniref:FAD-dependent oxidoreductase n=1 Tax=Antrihabitans spumae TaxID=3373370 RepID=A0ABW7KU50_9NOCA
MSRPRVVVAGLGDSGLLTAIRLARHADVVGISSKPGLVSGQELGSRLSRPDVWSADYRIAFDRFHRLDSFRSVHGLMIGADLVNRTVTIQLSDNTAAQEQYDVLVVATGVTNGFWHPNHRALVPAGFAFDRITDETIEWVGGQPAVTADAVLWAIGRVRPNTDWLPAELLDDDGFVRVAPDLHLPGHPRVFAIGDVAATDPLRSSARNRADRLLAHNIRAELAGRPLRTYRPPRRRWGSVVGTQPDGLQVFAPNGRAFRIPSWAVRSILRPLIVRRGIYLGVRKSSQAR